MANTQANLMIVVANPAPSRQPHYPRTWLLHAQKRAAKVHVTHVANAKPHIVDKSAA
jgi:hypothetical protein